MGLDPACKLCNRTKRVEGYKVQRLNPEWQYRRYKGTRRRYGDIKFLLTYEEFLELWQKPCYYCNDLIDTIGLDRRDSSGDYTKDNTVSCCMTCNLAKRKLTVEQFLTHCKKIADNWQTVLSFKEKVIHV